MTGFGTVETAIEAMKKGAYDYILKPFKVEEVVHIVERGLEKQRLISENIRLREIVGLHELSEQFQRTLSLEEIVESTLQTGVNNVGFELVAIYLADEDRKKLEESNYKTSRNAPPNATPGKLNVNEILKQLDTNGYILALDQDIAPYFLTPPPGLISLMCIPLVARERTIGLLAFHSYKPDTVFNEGQRKLTAMFASRIAAAIDNAMLYRDLQKTFRQTIQGLAIAIEAMDKYTAGHSDRVTIYARITAEQIGERKKHIELITQAGMLHDIGKLGCHTNLNKPGKLTDQEYEIFKAHPVFGKDILEPITFLKAIIPGVHLHHERWDGNGYPGGLKGEAIPKMARILAVADSYDAMTSNRAYRRALQHSVAITELKRCSGTQFDPAVVDSFLIAIEKYREECRKLGISYPL